MIKFSVSGFLTVITTAPADMASNILTVTVLYVLIKYLALLTAISVKSLCLPLSVPNDKLDLQNMTGVRQLRIKGIKSSLLIWQKQIEQTFGKGFYKHFCKQYDIYLQYYAFYKEIISKKYYRAFLIFIDASYKREILIKVGRTLVNQYARKKVDVFQDSPLFEPYLH